MAADRSCLHCALERALRAERAALEAAGLQVELMFSEGALLPDRGGRIYRQLRGMIREVQPLALPGPVRIAVLANIPGKSSVEVTATFGTENGWEIRSRMFSRYVLDALWPGFAEHGES